MYSLGLRTAVAHMPSVMHVRSLSFCRSFGDIGWSSSSATVSTTAWTAATKAAGAASAAGDSQTTLWCLTNRWTRMSVSEPHSGLSLLSSWASLPPGRSRRRPSGGLWPASAKRNEASKEGACRVRLILLHSGSFLGQELLNRTTIHIFKGCVT